MIIKGLCNPWMRSSLFLPEYHSCDSSDDKPLEESQRSTLENHGTMKETDEETTSDDECMLN